MVILLAGLRYRLLSETRVAVCPNFGSVFVLWLKGIPRKKGGARRSILMNWVTRARVSPSRRAMFAWSAPSNSRPRVSHLCPKSWEAYGNLPESTECVVLAWL